MNHFQNLWWRWWPAIDLHKILIKLFNSFFFWFDVNRELQTLSDKACISNVHISDNFLSRTIIHKTIITRLFLWFFFIRSVHKNRGVMSHSPRPRQSAFLHSQPISILHEKKRNSKGWVRTYCIKSLKSF